MASFLSRWGLPEDSQGQKLEKFINRLIARIGESPSASWSELKMFAFIAGVPVGKYGKQNSFNSNSWLEARLYFSNFEELYVLAKKMEVFLNSPILTDRVKESIIELMNHSHIGIRVSEKDGRYLTYPEGEKKLDNEVVEPALSALSGASAIEYTKALQEYSDSNWELSSEKTRRTLEEYLRDYLGNRTALKANIPKLGAFLKENKSVNEHLRISLINQLKNLDNQYNDGSKHWSITDGYVEAEYLIYSVGVMINTLEQIKIRNIQEG